MHCGPSDLKIEDALKEKKLHMNICCMRVVTSHSEALSYLEINTLVLEKIVERMNKETGHVVNL